jgi:hypothetical protein
MNQYDKKTIMPFVVLYKGLFDDFKDILNLLQNSKKSKVLVEWEPWYELGERTRFEFFNESDITENEKEHWMFQQKIYNTMIDAYKDYISDWTKPEIISKYKNTNPNLQEDWSRVFGDFVTHWDIENFISNESNEGWQKSPVEVLKHDHTVGRNLELAIGYHLDAFNSKDAAGPKSIITGTVYLNDDYEGGEISFLNEFDSSIINYKPKAGDFIIFPSAKPFFHAAQKVYGKDKYLIRNFLLWNHSGSERYKEGEQKFGKEQWALMQDYIRETEDLMGFYQKDVYLPGVSVYERIHGNGIPFFPKTVETWEE